MHRMSRNDRSGGVTPETTRSSRQNLDVMEEMNSVRWA
jgi:hypothetical protein